MKESKFYNLTIEEIEQVLSTSSEQGLFEKEVEERRAQYGYNAFQKKKHTPLWKKFLMQFKSFMIIVLLIAAAISGVVGFLNGEGFTDAIIILAIVILNAIIGVAQEAKAEKSLDALEKLSSPHCKVIRDGKLNTIESKELVPGDLVVIETGDSIPADLRLTEAVNLKIQEAALTGESVPEEKYTAKIEGEVSLGDCDNMAFGSTNVTYGRGKGVVTAIGMDSEVGKIASMIQTVPETKTPLQEKLDKLGKMLGIGAIAICLLIFIVGMLYGNDLMTMFMTAVSLAAAAIPEGLPAVSTIVLAVGVQKLVKKNAIVRKLPSVETLGSTQVICSDKTGTLTQNKMTVMQLFADGKIENVDQLTAENLGGFKMVMEGAVMANDAILTQNDDKWTTTGDPTETALVDLGLKFDLYKNELNVKYPRVAEIPFDSDRKMMTIVVDKDGILTVYVKGGLDEVLACCSSILENGEKREITEADRSKLKEANTRMAQEALRVLAVATSTIERLPEEIEPSTLELDLTFAGMLGMIDPPREEVRVAVEKCADAGIKPVMITGDHQITAVAIADYLGIKKEGDIVLTGMDVEKMSASELRKEVERVAVFARVSPEHKVRIVEAFQANGKIVAMTGDGVNDAPALKLADIGVAMGITGTDVSKEAADIVLADDNFATIVTAVEEGRRIYDNIIKAIQFMLATNIGEIIVLFVAIIANWAVPLLPIHILWINLVTDSLPALALSVDPATPNIMKRKPVDPKTGIMNRNFALHIALQGLMIGMLSLVAYKVGLQWGIDIARTMTFAVLAFCQITHVFNVRSNHYSAFRGLFSNKYLLGAIAIVIGLMLIVLEIPFLEDIFHVSNLDGVQWIWVIGLSLAPLVIMEIFKGIKRWIGRRSNVEY
ncbi:calcium-translocating P-type ATPase, PMCA-type [Bacteroidales bacterium OttesenSCG-928-B11]|nr:calcium-translocating P-type ATPase, PMCA-type [Bacteroidales bacterium OttesenSCG-928-C03]MDL2311429.1 calcium-translocating P-type ATPase, PMCA-type [Bacteroidales bacterium OttesenSCG-928-B11]